MKQGRTFIHSLALVGCLLLGSALAESQEWDPRTTRAVVVGVLTWDDSNISTFPAENRLDRLLYQRLLERGVSPDNMVLLLDRQATQKAILKAVEQILSGSKPGETFLFYYAGHGQPGDTCVEFLPYDFGESEGLKLDELATLIERKFQGDRVFLFADCCHSGGLSKVAARAELRGLQSVSLTSATEDKTSTSNWTFTRVLVDSLSGSSSADRNSDSQVTFRELTQEVVEAMYFYENQDAGYSPRPWLDDLIVAKAKDHSRTEHAPFTIFDYVRVVGGKFSGPNGRIVDRAGDLWVVELNGYSETTRHQFPIEALEPLPQLPSSVRDSKEATMNGRYSQLLKTFPMEFDFFRYGELKDYGHYRACDYGGFENLPEGYWVYLYPNWYIWGKKDE